MPANGGGMLIASSKEMLNEYENDTVKEVEAKSGCLYSIFISRSANLLDFRKKVLELGGTSPEFSEHPELMELFIPLL